MAENYSQKITIFNGEEYLDVSIRAATVTNIFFKEISKFLSGDTTASEPKYIAYGSSPSEIDFTKFDTSVDLEFDLEKQTETYHYQRIPLYNVTYSIDSSGNGQITFIFVDNSYQDYDDEYLREVGLCLGSSGDNAVALAKFDGYVQKPLNNSLEFEWTITLQ